MQTQRIKIFTFVRLKTQQVLCIHQQKFKSIVSTFHFRISTSFVFAMNKSPPAHSFILSQLTSFFCFIIFAVLFCNTCALPFLHEKQLYKSNYIIASMGDILMLPVVYSEITRSNPKLKLK